jgi:hypothetical protein
MWVTLDSARVVGKGETIPPGYRILVVMKQVGKGNVLRAMVQGIWVTW